MPLNTGAPAAVTGGTGDCSTPIGMARVNGHQHAIALLDHCVTQVQSCASAKPLQTLQVSETRISSHQQITRTLSPAAQVQSAMLVDPGALVRKAKAFVVQG